MVRKCSLSGGDGGVALLGSGAGGRGGQKIFTFRGQWRVLPYLEGGGNFIRGDSYLLLWCRKGWGVRDDFTQVEWGAYFNI